MARTVEGLFDLVNAESRFQSAEREMFLGSVLLLFATTLGLFYLALLPIGLADSWFFLLVPSFLIGLWGVIRYLVGRDRMNRALKDVRRLLEDEPGLEE
jgi:hypothetical protein